MPVRPEAAAAGTRSCVRMSGELVSVFVAALWRLYRAARAGRRARSITTFRRACALVVRACN